MMERVALSAGRCGSECVEYSVENSQKQKECLEEIKNMLISREDSFSCQDKDKKTNSVNEKELEREV